MAVASTWATGHSAVPLHQLRPALSNSSPSISPDTRISYTHIKKSATCNFPGNKFNQRNSKNPRRIYCLCSKSSDNLVDTWTSVLKEPVAFMGGIFAGLLRLDLNDEPLKEWINRTVEASGIIEDEISTSEAKAEETPEQIQID